MDEFWVCQHCRSLNRAGTGRCYHCRERQGSKPPEPSAVNRSAGAPNVVQLPSNPQAAASQAGYESRPAGTVSAFPDRGATIPQVTPDYLSRPVAPPPPPATDFTTRYRQAAMERSRRHWPSPTGPIRRRLSSSLATRPYISVHFIGYLSAMLATMFLLDGALLVTTFVPVGRTALRLGSITTALSQITKGNQWTLEVMTVSLIVIATVGLIVFSIFVGLSTRNAPGLGAAMPYLSPARATTAWFRIVRAQLFLAAGLLIPAVLIGYGLALPGLIVALVALEIAQRHLDDPFGWLTDAARHISDLLVKLDTSGSTRSLLGSAWRICFVGMNTVLIVAFAVPLVIASAVAAADLAGRRELVSWPGPESGPAQIACLVVAGSLILLSMLATILFVPVSIELVERQRTRRNLARVGRSRPWAGRPSAYEAPDLQPEQPPSDPYEHQPKSISKGWAQASLNSPSTTSSFPWEEGSSDEAGPD